jgi:hypothetical protein
MVLRPVLMYIFRASRCEGYEALVNEALGPITLFGSWIRGAGVRRARVLHYIELLGSWM